MKTLSLAKQNSRMYLNIIILTAIVLLALVYLFQINNLVRQSFIMRGYQKEYSELLNQHKKIEAEIAQKQSLVKLQEAAKNMNMFPADDINYLGVGKGKVVMNYWSP